MANFDWPSRQDAATGLPFRHHAVYVQLPFELFELVLYENRIVIPPRLGSGDEGRPPVYLRFHTAPHRATKLDLRAVDIAVRRAPSRRVALRNLVPWTEALRARARVAPVPQVSVAEIETALPRKGFDPDISQNLTDYSLAALNRFLDTYQVLTEQWNVHHLNPDNLGPELVVELRTESDQTTGTLAMPHNRSLLPHERPAFSPHLLNALPEALSMEPHNHPLDQVRRLYARASRYAETGEYEAAVEALQISIERLVFALHRLLLVENSRHSDEIPELLPPTFKRAITSLGQHLGGNWSVAGGGPVAGYWRDLYEVRNRLVHAGVTAERDVVPKAFEAYEALWNFVLERTLAVRAKHPRVALAVHGGIGLRKAEALDAAMRAFIRTVQDDGEKYSFWQPIDLR